MNTLLILIICSVHAYVALPTQQLSSENEEVESRIVSGQNAKRHEFPYMVSVQNETTREHRCGASIISATWLVSAVHCYEDRPANLVAVAGLLIQSENHPDVQVIPITEIVEHPGYSTAYKYNDIALLRVKYPFTFTNAVREVGLPRADGPVSGKVWVTGWGYISKDPPVFASYLQCLEMSVIPNKECNDIFAASPLNDNFYPYLVRNDQLCTLPAEVGQSACQGDSGGPLVQNGILLGIVHGGNVDCSTTLDRRYPDIFTKVSFFLDFINEHVKDLRRACQHQMKKPKWF